MSELTQLDKLKMVFKKAVAAEAKYVAILVRIGSMNGYETIINAGANALEKLVYFEKTYDLNLKSKHADIEIVSFTYANTYEGILGYFESYEKEAKLMDAQSGKTLWINGYNVQGISHTNFAVEQIGDTGMMEVSSVTLPPELVNKLEEENLRIEVRSEDAVLHSYIGWVRNYRRQAANPAMITDLVLVGADVEEERKEKTPNDKPKSTPKPRTKPKAIK